MEKRGVIWAGMAVVALGLAASAQNSTAQNSTTTQKSGSHTRPAKPVVRARLPKFDKRITQSIFFDNVFADAGPLKGPRPANLASASNAATGNNGKVGPTGSPSGSPASQGTASSSGWSKIISAESVEAEVKSIASQLQEDVSRPSLFAAGGNVKCRTHFSILALMFAIAGEYDGEIKWKSDAPAVRDAMAQTAANCKTNTEQVFKEVVRQRDDTLQKLLSGGSLSESKDAERAATWPRVADRGPLMQRLEMVKNNLGPWTSNKTEFQKNQEGIVSEAEVAAAIAAAIMKEGMEDAGDDDYDAEARRLLVNAQGLLEAVKLKNDEQARKALGEINKACSSCHENYRSS